MGAAETVQRASTLRARRVMVGDHHLGQTAEAVFDRDLRALAGLEVEALNGREYFLPGGAVDLREDPLRLESPLHLVDDTAFYRSVGRVLGEVIGLPAWFGRDRMRAVAEVLLGDAGTVTGFVLADGATVARAACEVEAARITVARQGRADGAPDRFAPSAQH